MYRILLMGTSDFATPSFETLINDDRFDVLGIVAQPDKPAGRKQEMKKPDTKLLAEKYNISCYQPNKVSDESFIEELKKMNLDIIFVVAYGQILSQEFLDIPKYGSVNLHASLLPQLRGASPIHTAILQGLEKTGITYMKMKKALDSGPIIKQFEVTVNDKNIVQLYDELKQFTSQTVADILNKYASGKLNLQEQDHEKASFCSSIKKEEGGINPLNDYAEDIMKKYRAFMVWPGIFFFKDNKRIKLLKIEDTQILTKSPGDLVVEENLLYLNAKDYKIKVNELQIEGKNRIFAKDYINSLKK